MSTRKDYLGDSVYIAFDGYGVILTTENGMESDPSNTIYMEPQVIQAFEQYLERIKKPTAQVDK